MSTLKKIAIVLFLFFSLGIYGCGGGGGDNNTPPEIKYQFWGVNFGNNLYSDPNTGGVVSDELTISLLDQIRPYFKVVRVFTAYNIPPGVTRMRHGHTFISYAIAKKLMSPTRSPGVKFIVTAWLSRDLQSNQEEVNALIDLAKTVPVYIATAGGEILDVLTEEQILGYMAELRTVKGLTVTVNDTWYQLQQHPNVANACDVLMPNIYPSWDDIDISVAVKYLREKYLLIKNLYGKETIIGETGWPSDGGPTEKAKYNPANAAYYFINVASWAEAEHIEVCYFESHDEPYKRNYEGELGAHWGIWDTNRNMKPGFQAVFDGVTVPNNWSK